MAKARASSDPAATHARESRRLSTLLEVSQALSGTLNLRSGLHRVLEVLAKHHGTVRSLITLLHDNGEHTGRSYYEPRKRQRKRPPLNPTTWTGSDWFI